MRKEKTENLFLISLFCIVILITFTVEEGLGIWSDGSILSVGMVLLIFGG